MKKLKQMIFLLTWLAVFFIAGNLDSGEMSLKSAFIAITVNFIIMAWSGFSSGLLVVPDKKDKFIILNRKVKNIPSEKQQELIEMARVMFKEDFHE